MVENDFSRAYWSRTMQALRNDASGAVCFSPSLASDFPRNVNENGRIEISILL